MDIPVPTLVEKQVKLAEFILEQLDPKLLTSGLTGKISLDDYPKFVAVVCDDKVVTIVDRKSFSYNKIPKIQDYSKASRLIPEQ